MNKFEIFIRDEQKNRVGQLETFTSLAFIRRINAVGSWVLTSTPDALAILGKKGGIDVYRNGEPHFSGDMSEFEDVNGREMAVNGYDDLDSIAGRLALPVPSGAPYNVDYDVRSGTAESVIKTYVNLNAGPGARVDRQITGLTIETNGGRGNTVTGRARFDNLLTFINSLALQGGIGFRVRSSIFEVFIPTDKTKNIVFSENFGTLGSYTYREKRGKVNYIYCGGTGEGSARSFYEKPNSDAIVSWGRYESFVDKRNTSAVAELSAAASEELDKQSNQISLDFQPVVTSNMKPVDDYDIGDWVTAIIKGEEIHQQIREMKTTIDVSGAEINELVIGTEGATTDLSGLSAVYSRMRGIDQRLNTMERR